MKKFLLFVLMLMFVLSLAACGGNEEAPAEDTEGGNEQGATLEGSVIVDGSGTVYPLMARIAEEYMVAKQPDVSVQVGRAGTSAGFKKFISGETDFSNASRAIKEEETTQLKDQGMTVGENVLEFKLAYDGLTMVINKENTWAKEMTKDEIVNMYLSGKYNADDKIKWSDIRSDWPSDEIKFYGPNENHGTFEFFHEVILNKQEMVKTANLQQEYSTLVDLVSKEKNAIAFFGFGYYVSNQDKLQAVAVDFGDGKPVLPSLETIGENLPYAGFTRPVYTYMNAQHATDKPEVLDFAKYVMEGAPQFAGETGFAPLPQEQYDSYLEQLNAIK